MTATQTFRNTVIVLATILGAYALYRSIHIIVVLTVAVVVASAVQPAVLRLRKWGFGKNAAILMVYGALALAILLVGLLVLPPIAQQFASYMGDDHSLADRVLAAQTWIQSFILDHTGTYVALFNPSDISTTIAQIIQQVKMAMPAMAGEFGSLLGDSILVLVIGIYWLSTRNATAHFLLELFPIGQRSMVDEIILESEAAIGTYARGLALICAFVGFANFLILSLLGVPNALMLAFIVGLTTALPIVGGYIGAATATLLALLSSPLYALFALGSFLLVQQVESHYLTPRVMARSVGLDPILVIVLLFGGYALGGVIGAVLALPVASILTIMLRHFIIEPRKGETSPQFVEGGLLIPGTPQDVS